MKEIRRSLQMRFDTMQKREFFGLFIVFLFFLTMIVTIERSAPTVVNSIEFSSKRILKDFHLSLNKINEFHQRLLLTAKLNEVDRSTVKIYIKMNGVYSDNRTIACTKQACNEILLVQLNGLEESQYRFGVQIDSNSQTETKTQIEPNFFFNSVNPNYTVFELLFRFILLLISTVALCIFSRSIAEFSIVDWSMEQSWTLILLFILIFYNDPFFPVKLFVSNSSPMVADGSFRMILFAFILVFWLAIYHGIRQNNRRLFSFYFPKFIVVFPFCLCISQLWSEHVTEQFENSINSIHHEPHQWTWTKLLVLVFGSIYLLYLAFLIVRAFGEAQDNPFFDVQLRFTTISIFLFASLLICASFLKISLQIFNENILPAVSVHFQTTLGFFAFDCFVNFYLLLLAYIYSPSETASVDELLSENPAFQLLHNDEQENIFYESDSESVSLRSRR